MSDSSNADQYGSDIDQYAPVDSPGAGERIANDIPLAKPVYGIAQEINDAVNGDTSIADAAGAHVAHRCTAVRLTRAVPDRRSLMPASRLPGFALRRLKNQTRPIAASVMVSPPRLKGGI